MTRIFIKPAPQTEPKKGEEAGPLRTVRKPTNGHLDAGGEWVNRESYWLRRLNDGDVVQDVDAVEPSEPAAAPAAADAVRKSSKAI